MLTRSRAAVAAVALFATCGIALGAGMWSNLTGIGVGSFCVSTQTGTGALSGITGTGQGTLGSLCAQTTPAGPATFAGTEYFPVDIGPLGTGSQAGGASTSTVGINQLGQGTIVDSVASGAAVTIPANAQFFTLDTGTAATVAATMPAGAVEGQIQHLLCGVAVGTALSVVGNTSQTIKGNTPATCTAGQAFAWRFSAVANGLIVANTWLRIQ